MEYYKHKNWTIEEILNRIGGDDPLDDFDMKRLMEFNENLKVDSDNRWYAGDKDREKYMEPDTDGEFRVYKYYKREEALVKNKTEWSNITLLKKKLETLGANYKLKIHEKKYLLLLLWPNGFQNSKLFNHIYYINGDYLNNIKQTIKDSEWSEDDGTFYFYFPLTHSATQKEMYDILTKLVRVVDECPEEDDGEF